jgi:transposase
MAVDAGMSRRGAAERFEVAASTAVRWVKEWRATGAMRAKPKGGDRRSHRAEAHGQFILSAIDETVDISLVELADKLRAERGANVSPSTVHRFLERHDMTVKKKRRTPRSSSGPT